MKQETQNEICLVFSEMTTETFFIFDREGEIIYWNKIAEETLGYSNGFWDINIMDIFGKVLRIVDGRVQVGEEVQIELINGYQVIETVAYRQNQTVCPVEIRLSMKEEREAYGLCLAISLASQKAAQRNVKKAQKTIDAATNLRNEFVANVTHELRTPVNGIMGFTENLLETELTQEQKEALQIIEHCCHNMNRIIDNLLDFSKLESGKFTMEEKEFRFRSFMDKTMETNLAKINDKGLRLMVSIAPDIPEYVIGDELRLGQILNNLISNAVKFTSTGHISVEVVKTLETNTELELFFMVIDTGIGIEEEEKDKLFKSFSQVDASITRRFGGTGLGLSITRELVNLMNGEIDVQSEKGKGSTFSFSVRLKKAEEQKNMSEEVYTGWYTYEGLVKVKMERFDTYEADEVYRFGSAENQKEMVNALEKLVICIEMENWQKAENFAATVKGLIPAEQKEIYREAFRLELIVRKADKKKALEQYEEVEKEVFEYYQRL